MSILHNYWRRCRTLVWDVCIITHGCYHWMSCHVLIKTFLLSLIPPEVLNLYLLSLFINYVFLFCRFVMYRNMECCTMLPKWFFSQMNMCCRLCLGGGRLVWGGHGAAQPIAIWIESTEYGEYLQCYKCNATQCWHGVNSCCLVINLFVLWCFSTYYTVLVLHHIIFFLWSWMKKILLQGCSLIGFKVCVTGSYMICPDIFWITTYVGKNVCLLKDGV
jgi:hypothetical protein